MCGVPVPFISTIVLFRLQYIFSAKLTYKHFHGIRSRIILVKLRFLTYLGYTVCRFHGYLPEVISLRTRMTSDVDAP